MRKTDLRVIKDNHNNTIATASLNADGKMSVEPYNDAKIEYHRTTPKLGHSSVDNFIHDVILPLEKDKIPMNSMWFAYLVYCASNGITAESQKAFSRDADELFNDSYFHVKMTVTKSIIEDFKNDEHVDDKLKPYLSVMETNLGEIDHYISGYFSKQAFMLERGADAIKAGLMTDNTKSIIDYLKEVIAPDYEYQRITTEALFRGYAKYCATEEIEQVPRMLFNRVISQRINEFGWHKATSRIRQVDRDAINALATDNVRLYGTISANLTTSKTPVACVVKK